MALDRSAILLPNAQDPSSAVLRKISDQPVVLADANKGDETLYSTAKNLQVVPSQPSLRIARTI